jgi:hypothetical protein
MSSTHNSMKRLSSSVHRLSSTSTLSSKTHTGQSTPRSPFSRYVHSRLFYHHADNLGNCNLLHSYICILQDARQPPTRSSILPTHCQPDGNLRPEVPGMVQGACQPRTTCPKRTSTESTCCLGGIDRHGGCPLSALPVRLKYVERVRGEGNQHAVAVRRAGASRSRRHGARQEEPRQFMSTVHQYEVVGDSRRAVATHQRAGNRLNTCRIQQPTTQPALDPAFVVGATVGRRPYIPAS